MRLPTRRMVALSLGQSNSGNHGPVRADAGNGSWVITARGAAPARDPLPGATGNGGSVWTRFAPMVIREGLFDEVVLAPASAGGTAMADWAPGGACQQRIDHAVAEVRAAGLEITHVFWNQGERDTFLGTDGDAYRRDLAALIADLRGRQIAAPIIVCTSTYRFGMVNPEVRRAQQAVIDPAVSVFPGPDTDAIGPEFRYDDCHFDERGQQHFAAGLVRSVAGLLFTTGSPA